MFKKKPQLLAILLSVLLVSLSGCGKVLSQTDISRALKYCESREGLFSLEVYYSSIVKTATCKNGEVANTNEMAKAH